MIIVSQDKLELVVLQNVFKIEITTGKLKQVITADGHKLAEYKTEERAKEVLEEIGNAYVVTQMLLYPTMTTTASLRGEDVAKIISYEMPAE